MIGLSQNPMALLLHVRELSFVITNFRFFCFKEMADFSKYSHFNKVINYLLSCRKPSFCHERVNNILRIECWKL